MRTLKLEIKIIGENQELKKDRLKQIANDVWKAANIMITSQFMSYQFMKDAIELVDFDLNIKYKRIKEIKKLLKKNKNLKSKSESKLEKELKELKDERKKEKDERMKIINDDFKSKFGVLKDSLSERNVKLTFNNLPPNVTNSLKNNIKSNWNNEIWDINNGIKSIRSYKKGLPIPISVNSMSFKKDNNNFNFNWRVCKGEDILFKIRLGKDSGNYKLTLDKIVNEILKYSISSIEYKKKKFFLNLCVNDIEKKVGLNTNISLGVDLGIRTPAYIATNELASRPLGNINDFFKVRKAIQRKKEKSKKDAVMSKGGHGRKRKLKAINRNTKTERNFAKTYNHKISKEIIKFALQENAGVIKLEMLEGYGNKKSNKYILRSWSYFELQQYIKYKAEQLGIIVKFVDPYHTSQICSKCNHYEPNQRDNDNLFTCKKCGLEINGDHNAAINIANSKKYVTSKEECEISQQKKTRIELFNIFNNKSELGIKTVDGMIDINEFVTHEIIKKRIKNNNEHLNSVIRKAPSLCFTDDNSKIYKKVFKEK